MSELYSITCKNKACRYHKELRSGVGMDGFVQIKNYENDILDGKIENIKALKSIKEGGHIQACGIYLCSQCRELVNNAAYYLVENIIYSPYGTPRYDITFPFGEPLCTQCGSKLEYIWNVLSSKVKCPRCGEELRTRKSGRFD